ncbi:unnamed protein product [Penicillium salamii]|uniref:A to I editase domain-containing protein n=1 Tax=Penicillium salamii TaxID=1612424 RepID=A0A9W4NVS6_9EURO|nr:unnamed protein product [Penicillium salamii]
MYIETSDLPLSSRIASLVHAHFDALPARSKPSAFPDGSREWIPMAGIVAVKGNFAVVLSGAKCLSASHIPRCNGLVLHDCHAEILAIRAFNYWLLTECSGLLSQEKQLTPDSPESKAREFSSSSLIQRRKTTGDREDSPQPKPEWPPFEIQPDINIYMYCTCAPCGDGSMELCMAAQEDATPWEIPQQSSSTSQESDEIPTETFLDGRANFSLLGIVRRKPSRTDAESTRSKSCSDKLALRQVSSLLSCETSRLVAPTRNAYVAGLILPEEEISQVACERSFGENGRMKALAGRSWPSTMNDETEPSYRFRPFRILSVPTEEVSALWGFAKPKPIPCPAVSAENEETPKSQPPRKSKPGNASAIWTLAPSYYIPSATMEIGSKTVPTLRRSKTGLYETVINGVKQGNRASAPDARGASALSRAKLWALFHNIISEPTSVSTCDDSEVASEKAPKASTYQEFKTPSSGEDPSGIRMQARRDAQRVLKGWMPNSGDEAWSLNVLVDTKKRKR